MPSFLYNIQTSVEVTADTEEDAMMIISTSKEWHNNRIIDTDILFVDEYDGERCDCDECVEIESMV